MGGLSGGSVYVTRPLDSSEDAWTPYPSRWAANVTGMAPDPDEPIDFDAVHKNRVLILKIVFLVVPAWVCVIYYFAVYRGGTAAVVDSFVEAARLGKAPTILFPDDESAAAIAVLRASQSTRVSNWTSSSSAACVWMKVQTAQGDVPVEFFLEERGHRLTVSRLSTKEHCDCHGKGRRRG